MSFTRTIYSTIKFDENNYSEKNCLDCGKQFDASL